MGGLRPLFPLGRGWNAGLAYDTEIEYLESTGTQWIDTGVAPSFDSDFDVYATVCPLNDGRKVALGNFTDGSAYEDGRAMCSLEFGGTSNDKPYCPRGWFRANNSQSYSLFANAVPQYSVSEMSISFRVSTSVCGLKAGGGKYEQTATVGGTNPQINLRMFRDYRVPSGIIDNGCRIYSASIYIGGVLVRDFIPVRRKNKGYMYDRVTGRLFEAQGTGDLIKGPDKVFTEVGYITSTGNVVVPLDFVLASGNLTAKHTFIGSVAGAWSSGSQYQGRLLDSGLVNPATELPQNEKSGFTLGYCSNPDRRNTIHYGYQNWWNAANADNYSYNQFHTFVLQHSTNIKQIATYTRDGTTVTLLDASRVGTYTDNQRDPTYNDRPMVLFGRYDYSTNTYGYFSVNPWKFGGWKIELNNQVIHEYVPALLNGTRVGVWDKTTNRFFYPFGSGTLTYGSR